MVYPQLSKPTPATLAQSPATGPCCLGEFMLGEPELSARATCSVSCSSGQEPWSQWQSTVHSVPGRTLASWWWGPEEQPCCCA